MHLPGPSEASGPPLLAGEPHARGRAQLRGSERSMVLAATLGRVEQARAAGILDADAEAYLDAQHGFTLAHAPAAIEEIEGIAAGLGIAARILFTHQHLGVLRDRKHAAGLAADGCSAWAVADGPDGPLLVKNRDFSGTHAGIQGVFRHEGPDIATGFMVCVGSLGSPGAYSSGVNGAGLALADTQVATRDHGVGWLRYFLMTEILKRCRCVTEAVALARASTHAGGGTLVAADASGTTAALELGHRGVAVSQGGCVWRTNHFVSQALSAQTLPAADGIADTSVRRHGLLARALPGRSWSADAAAALMSGHGEGGGLCQHGEADGATTIASAIFATSARRLYVTLDTPCRGGWRRYDWDG